MIESYEKLMPTAQMSDFFNFEIFSMCFVFTLSFFRLNKDNIKEDNLKRCKILRCATAAIMIYIYLNYKLQTVKSYRTE